MSDDILFTTSSGEDIILDTASIIIISIAFGGIFLGALIALIVKLIAKKETQSDNEIEIVHTPPAYSEPETESETGLPAQSSFVKSLSVLTVQLFSLHDICISFLAYSEPETESETGLPAYSEPETESETGLPAYSKLGSPAKPEPVYGNVGTSSGEVGIYVGTSSIERYSGGINNSEYLYQLSLFKYI